MKVKMNALAGLLLLIFLAWGCKKNDSLPVFEEAKTLMNVSYGTNAEQKADIYLPAGRSGSRTKVIALIHGGGWMSGDKNNMKNHVAEFQAQMKDYALVNINYRLVNLLSVPPYMLPMQTDDISAAMDFVERKAAEYGVKPQFIVLGLSAGGHLAMLSSYRHDAKRRVKAVVNIVGPCNLNDPFYLNNPVYNFGLNYIVAPADLPKNMSAAVYGSPVTWVTAAAPPTVSFYGSTDEYIPASQHSTLAQKLDEFKIANERHIYKGGHQVAFDQAKDIVAKTNLFLQKYMK